jgi:hypothetical protein
MPDPNQTTLNMPWVEQTPDPNQTTLNLPAWMFQTQQTDPNRTTLADPFGLYAGIANGTLNPTRTAPLLVAPGLAPGLTMNASAAGFLADHQQALMILAAAFAGLAVLKAFSR